MTDSLRGARDLLASRDVAFTVALFPFLLRDGDGLASRPSLSRVEAFCVAEGMRVFDGEPAFLDAEIPLEELRVSPHDYHANGRAYGLFARSLADWL